MATKKVTETDKAEDVQLDVEEPKTSYKPKEREISTFKIGTKQPDWFKKALGKQINTFLPPISDPLHYNVEINNDLVVMFPNGGNFTAGSWVVKDVDGFHGYTDKDFKKLFEEQ